MARINIFILSLISVAYCQPSEVKEEKRSLEYSITKSWDGKPLPVEDQINVTLQESSIGIKLLFSLPLYDDNEANCQPGMNRTPLWRCEALEFYFANDKDEYILAMYGPYGEKNTYFYEGERNEVRNVIPSIYEARINGSLWTGICFIPFKHLPYNVTKFNLGSYHGVGENRRFKLLYPTDGTLPEPDFHKLKFFKPIDLTMIFGDNYQLQDSEWDAIRKGSLNYTITTTFNGKPLRAQDYVNITLDGVSEPDCLCVKIEAPFYEDNDPKCRPGPNQIDLFQCEDVEVYFSNDKSQYLQVAFSPYGDSQVLLFDGERNLVRVCLNVTTFEASINGSKWKGKAHIPREYFPLKVKKFNAASTHGYGENRTYNALYSDKYSATTPDFHQLQYFQPIDMSLLRSYNRNQSFIWEEALNGKLNFTIATTWNGKPIPAEQSVNITLDGVTHPEGLCVRICAPLYFGNNSTCTSAGGASLDCEGVELYFLNKTDNYLKLRIGPSGDYEVQLFNGRENLFKSNLTLEYFKTNISESKWNASALVPKEFLPFMPKKFNAASYHGLAEDKKCNVLYPADETYSKSDYPILSLFKTVDFALVRSFLWNPSKIWEKAEK